jgi:hypothetical protein
MVQALRMTFLGSSRVSLPARSTANHDSVSLRGVDTPFHPGGTLFGERFLIGDRLGVGAMGAVYAAFDRVRRERVALKTLHHMSATAIYAIKDEFRSLIDVVHPNVLNLYELFADGEHWFFTMELIEGTDFLSYLAAARKASRAQAGAAPNQLRLAFQQLTAGIDAIHAAGKLHLDLKPSNVLVTRDGRVVILDFGLVRELSLRQRDELVGTPAYMAPEQASAGPVTAASDWYAMGTMLFEALTERRPFDGPSVRIIANKILKPAPRASDFAPVPPELDELCDGLLSRDALCRPGSQEIRAALGMASPGSVRTSFAPGSVRPPFVGRELELAKIREQYAHALTGKAVLCVLSAPSGMGKSALAAQFLATLDQVERPLTFSGRCFERESVPYSGIDSLADELGIYLGQSDESEVEALLGSDPSDLLRAFPVLRGVPAIVRRCRQTVETADVQAAKRRAIASLRELLGGLSRKRPVLLFIDDLQWADLDSIRLLVELISPPDLGALFVLAGCRNDEHEPCTPLRELREQHAVDGDPTQISEIVIGPLDDASALRLAAATSHASSGADARASRIVDDAGGNPFFIEVLGRLVSEGGELARSASSLDRVIVEQIAGQSEQAQRLLAVIAVAGQPISQDVAVAAAGVGNRALASMNELRAARFVRTTRVPQRELVETYHDRIRESFYASLSRETLRECHGRLARALEASGDAAPDFLARQFFGAGDLPRSGGYATTAAEQAEKALAFERAAELYGLACQCVSEPVLQGELRARQARALVSSGRCVLASKQYLAASRLVDAERGFEFRRLAARQLFTAGHLEEALDTLRPLLHEVGLRYPETQREVLKRTLLALLRLKLRGLGFRQLAVDQSSSALARRADVARSTAEGLASTDPIRAASVMLEGVWLSLELGEPSRLAWALSHYALLLGSKGSPKSQVASTRLFGHATALAKGAASPDAEAVVRLNRAKLSLSLGAWADALEYSDDCSSYVRHECADGWGYMTVAHNIALFALQAAGAVAELNRRASEYVRVASDVGDLYAEVSVMIYSAAGALATSDAVGARERVQRALRRWKKEHFLFQNWLAVQAESQCDLYEGHAERAFARVQGAWAQMEARYLLKLSVVRPFALRLRASAALSMARRARQGELAAYLKIAQRDGAALARIGRHDARGWSALIEAGLHDLRGNGERSVRALGQAAQHFRSAGMPLEAESALFQRGRLVGGTEGTEQRLSADRSLTERGVRDPARWAALVTAMPA